jgi:hypothetical protein
MALSMASCTASQKVNLDLDSEILSIATHPEKVPTSIEERSRTDNIAAYYRNPDTRKSVVEFFSVLTRSQNVAVAILDGAADHKVNASLAFALAYEESRFNPNAYGKNAGSVDRGLFQLNSTTFPDLTEAEAFNPERNAQEGIKYFRHVLDLAGNEISALAMYNAGRTRVSQRGAPVKTLDYISRIINYEKNINSLFTARIIARTSLLARIRLGMLTEGQGTL